MESYSKNKEVSNKEIIKDYNRIYLTFGLRTNTAYYRWIIRLLHLKPKTTILDVSCGEGILLNEILKLDKGIQTYGLDISEVAVTIAQKKSSASKFIIADGQRIPLKDNLFDYVTCLGSLEHYLEPELGIRELVRAGKDEATFCIVLPNSFNIDLLLEVLKTGGRTQDVFQIIEKRATKNEWINLLNKNGLTVRAMYASNLWPELFQEGTFKIKSISKFYRRLLIGYFCPLNFAREFVFICTKNKRD